MYVMLNASNWVDLIRIQLKSSRDCNDANLSGYACLCVGKKFDEVIEKYYSEIDEHLGPYLHVFSFFPPPPKLYEKRLKEIRYSGFIDNKKDEIIQLLQDQHNSERVYQFERRTIIHEKVQLLKELSNLGLPTDQYIDFIFFSFSPDSNDTIQIYGTKTCPMKDGESLYKYVDFFKRMGDKAYKHYAAGNPLETFVKDLTWDFTMGMLVKRGLDLFNFIKVIKPFL